MYVTRDLSKTTFSGVVMGVRLELAEKLELRNGFLKSTGKGRAGGDAKTREALLFFFF